jgi:hypothetical protein
MPITTATDAETESALPATTPSVPPEYEPIRDAGKSESSLLQAT